MSDPVAPVAPVADRGSRAPSPPRDPVIGHLRWMRADPARFYVRSMVRYGDVVRFEFANGPVHLLTHPALVRRVLQERPLDFIKESPGFRWMKELMGEGLVTSLGDLWKRQRRIVQPLFHRDRLSAYALVMVEATRELLGRLERRAADGSVFDLGEEITRATLRMVGEALLGTDVRGDAQAVAHAVTFLSTSMSGRLTRVVNLPAFVPTNENRRYRHELAVLLDLIDRIVRERRVVAASSDRVDLLTLLLRARDPESGEQMSDRQIRDEVMTMFLAGHETVASGLTWAFACLARSPTARRRLDAEIDRVLGDRAPTLDDLPALVWTEQVVKEVLRLYPPISHIPRKVVRDDEEMNGYRIPRGSLVLLSPYATHRRADFWPNPEGFDPERFSPEAEAARPRYAYFPFGGGPRVCIGGVFATVEMQVILSMVARRFDVELVPGPPVEPVMRFTLRPAHGLAVRVRRRTNVTRLPSEPAS